MYSKLPVPSASSSRGICPTCLTHLVGDVSPWAGCCAQQSQGPSPPAGQRSFVQIFQGQQCLPLQSLKVTLVSVKSLLCFSCRRLLVPLALNSKQPRGVSFNTAWNRRKCFTGLACCCIFPFGNIKIFARLPIKAKKAAGRSLFPLREFGGFTMLRRKPVNGRWELTGVPLNSVCKKSFYVFFLFRNRDFLTFQWTEMYFFLTTDNGKNAAEGKTAEVQF